MSDSKLISSVQLGVETLRKHIKKLPDTPGVYRMISDAGDVLYVGKAKSLKKRVSSYTHAGKLPVRLQRMVALTRDMEFVHTHTEAEALLLESNLIKKLKPRFNVLLRDDKSFPYILLTGDHDFAQVIKHRGAKKRKGTYYGPFASAGDVNRTIGILQKAFMLRNCTDSYFAQRKRPCLQYHIKRCTAPCVGLVSVEEYAEQSAQARAFLEGRSDVVQERMAGAMQEASACQDYELAAQYRDRIQALSSIQAHQDINVEGLADVDVVALAQKAGRSCVQVFFFRGGHNHGNRSYFPRHDADEEGAVILSSFLAQFYEDKPVPSEILVSEVPDDLDVLQDALSVKSDRTKVRITASVRSARRRLLDFALKNACASLDKHLSDKANEGQMLEGLMKLFDMDDVPGRIEVYDNSHISGTNMVGGMVVAGPDGFNKSAYRKFNIKSAKAADDYGMMREVMERRFKRALEDDGAAEEWPDLLLIDGGKGQLSACQEVLEEYGVLDRLSVVAISKGEDRNAGREKFHMIGRPVFDLPVNDPVLHYLQRLRDEAHRFAIGAHRARRKKQISASPLDEVAGIGAKRKKALLLRFGSAKAVAEAGVEDLMSASGISRSIAEKIYDHFH